MIVTPVKVKAFAHCQNPMCPGYGQQEVDAVQTEYAWTYGDSDPKSPFKNMVDRSTVMFAYADEQDRPCRSCGADRELTGQARPAYQALSGYDPMGLLNSKFDAATVNTPHDAELADLRAQMKRQADQIETLLARVAEVPGDAA